MSGFDPAIDALLDDARDRAGRYLRALPDRRVAPAEAAVAGLAAFDRPLLSEGHSPAETLAVLDAIGSPATVASAGGRYFGFVTGGAYPVTVAASWLARAWDQNGSMSVMSPTAAALERVAVGWLVDLLGLPASAGGALVTGATMANASALLAARNALLTRVGWNVDADGLFGAPPIRVIVGAEAHSSLFKALSMAGLGRDRVERMPVDDQGAVCADALPALDDRPTIVALQAGNVNTGASDPFSTLIPAARERGAWVHVDGAFGLWAVTSPALASLVHGVDGADSWATDAHKWLNVPFDCGAVFVRDEATLAAAFSQEAAYLHSDAPRDAMRLTPESSQRARGVEVWAALHHLGRSGVAKLVERCCALARRAAQGLHAGGLRVHNRVVLNQVLFSAEDDRATTALMRRVQDDGRTWVGPSRWKGRHAIRLGVSSWATTEDDIDAAVSSIVELR